MTKAGTFLVAHLDPGEGRGVRPGWQATLVGARAIGLGGHPPEQRQYADQREPERIRPLGKCERRNHLGSQQGRLPGHSTSHRARGLQACKWKHADQQLGRQCSHRRMAYDRAADRSDSGEKAGLGVARLERSRPGVLYSIAGRTWNPEKRELQRGGHCLELRAGMEPGPCSQKKAANETRVGQGNIIPL